MAVVIDQPTQVEVAGNKPKIIKEYIGRVNSKTDDLSIAQMSSPAGWVEPGQTPEFDEYTIVLEGVLKVKTRTDEFDVQKGQAVVAEKGEWFNIQPPPMKTARSMSRYACRHFHRRPSAATNLNKGGLNS